MLQLKVDNTVFSECKMLADAENIDISLITCFCVTTTMTSYVIISEEICLWTLQPSAWGYF